MHRLFPCLVGGLMIIFLPQNLLAEEPDGPQGPRPAQPVGPNSEVMFNRLDANHDGVITEDELPPGMPEVFKQLLLLADSNGDGKITKDELTAALNRQRPGPGRDTPPYGRRFRGPDGQADQMAGPPFGRPGMGPGPMAKQGFGGPGMGPGGMAGPPFAGPEGRPDLMAGRPRNSAGIENSDESPQVRVYSIKTADPQTTLKVMQTLLAGKPDVRMDIDPKTNNLIVIARPAEHATILATLDKMQPDAKQVEAIPVRIPGPPFNGPEGRPGWMTGQGFGGPGRGPAWMTGPRFGGPGWQHPQWQRPPFGGPGRGPDWMAGQRYGGPGRGPDWMAGQRHGGPGRGPDWMAGQRYGGPGWQHPQWQRPPFGGPYGRPNRPWQANYANYAGPHRPQLNLKALFDRLDQNKDHQLSFEEFSQGTKRLMQATGPGRGPQWARPVGAFEGQRFGPPAFQAMANYPIPQPEMIKERVTRLFQNFNKNQDGKLTKDEAPPMIQKNFDRIDVDKKGYITPRDLYRALTQMRQRPGNQKSVERGAEKTPEQPPAKDKSQ